MSRLRFILESLRYHRRMNLAVALGGRAGAAVLTGALLVGDSVRGSLRHLALDRLGWVDDVLVVDRFFRADLEAGLLAESSGPGRLRFHSRTVPGIMLQGSVSD